MRFLLKIVDPLDVKPYCTDVHGAHKGPDVPACVRNAAAD